MFSGIIAGITWGLETIIIGIALAMSPFCATEEAIFLAPLVSTFIHDAFSAIWATIYNAVKGNAGNVWRAFKTRDGKFVSLAAMIGGPIGMTGYLMAVKYMSAAIGSVASAIFPAIGAVLAYIFLKEKMKWYQWVFLLLTIAGVYGLWYDPNIVVENFVLGLIGALMCAFGWGIEGVILAKSLKTDEVTDEYALQIRQTTSALTYGIIVLPVLRLMGYHSWGFAISLFKGTGWLIPTIVLAALAATVSYLFYYKAIATIGASKSMALNITYAAWAMIFTVVFLHDTSVITPLSIVCTIVVIVCSVFAAADFKELFSKTKEE